MIGLLGYTARAGSREAVARRRSLKRVGKAGIPLIRLQFSRCGRPPAVAAALVTLLFAVAPAPAAAPDVPSHFDQHVAPVLARHCLDCHNPSEKKSGLDLTSADAAKAGGESGAVISPGRPDDSLLWKHISSDEMPPKKPLPAAEKQLLRDWIAAGAAWGTAPTIDRFKYTSASRAGYDWWSLRPLSEAQPPQVKDAAWARNPVDRFVLAKLEEKGLTPAPEADRRTLIRRVTFDLTGLPPTAAEIDTFLNDNAPDAYDRLVDRLLASPAYGERWARHWLDVVRFGESNGFERDQLRPGAWRYRDWVIGALNDDLPYDQFVRMQIAGDVLRPDDPAAVVATGFLVAGPYDDAGQKQQSEAMRAVVRADELEELVGATAQTFLGLTVNCSRCHDHKFDPISQVDYYRFTSALSGVRQGERESLSDGGKAAAQKAAAGLDERLGQLKGRLAAMEAPARKKILARRDLQQAAVEAPKPLARWDFDTDLRDAVGSMHGEARGGARVENGRLVLDGKDDYVVTAPLPGTLEAKTFEAWVSLDTLDQAGGGVIAVQVPEGNLFDAVVYGERDARQWMAGSEFFSRTQSFSAPAEDAARDRLVHIAVVWAPDYTISAYRDGRPYGKPYTVDKVRAFPAGQAQVVFGMRHAPAGGNKMLAGTIDRARVYDRALTPEEIARSAGLRDETVSADEIRAELPPTDRAAWEALTEATSRLESRRLLLLGGKAYAAVPSQPEPTRVHHRGQPGQPREVVPPAGLAALSTAVPSDFGLPPDAPEAQRRAKLAEWMTDPRNPLASRVITNRLWHYHFGAGIVDTPNDFGFSGGRPSHPELLDWLAADLVRGGWSLKRLHRTIVTSATYRQSARVLPAARQTDADNRLLWRKTPVRLEAEAVRDAVLAVAGQLNPAAGGPGYQDFNIRIHNSTFYDAVDHTAFEFNRRSIYRTWARSGTNRLLDVFDCPDPSTLTPRRVATTTPLQALSLLNNPFVLRMADAFAGRLKYEAGEDVRGQIRLAYRLAYAREPEPDELEDGTRFVGEHGLAALCRAVFNSNEFLYVD